MPDLPQPWSGRDAAAGTPHWMRPAGTGCVHDSGLRYRIADSAGEVIIWLAGELDIITLPDLCLALELARSGQAPVIVDCSALTFLDVAALRFLLRARGRARASGSDLTLANPQGLVRRLLETTDSLSLASPHPACSQRAAVPVIPARNAICQAAVAAAAQITGTCRGNIQLIDPVAQHLRIAAQQGFERPFLRFFAIVDDTSSACGTALQSGSLVWVPDVTRSPIFAGTTAQEVMLDAGSHAVASMPIRAPDGHLIAMISAHYDAPVTWQHLHMLHLQRLAQVTGNLIWQHTPPAAVPPDPATDE